MMRSTSERFARGRNNCLFHRYAASTVAAGFVGSANRLDLKFNARFGGRLATREREVPVRQREVWREVIRRPLLYWILLWLAFTVGALVAVIPFAPSLSVMVFMVILFKAQSNARRRRAAELRQACSSRT
jgi:polyferredoxin